MAGLDPAIQNLKVAPMPRRSFVYMLASGRNGTIYTGVTSSLAARVDQHKRGQGSAFTRRYGVELLVYYEVHTSISAAIQRESNIKHWPRKWKLDLIESVNPQWKDLFDEIGPAD